MSTIQVFFLGMMVGVVLGVTTVFWYADRWYYKRTGRRPNYFVYWKRH